MMEQSKVIIYVTAIEKDIDLHMCSLFNCCVFASSLSHGTSHVAIA